MRVEIRKDDTLAIKGIAIVFMLIHHFITFPDWWIANIEVDLPMALANGLNYPTCVCVPVFAFLTGYGLAKTENTSFKALCARVIKLLKEYYFYYLILVMIAITLGGYTLSVKDILNDLLCLSQPVMVFCWYVRFYIISIVLLFCVEKFLQKNIIIGILVGIIVPLFVFLPLQAVTTGLLHKIFW